MSDYNSDEDIGYGSDNDIQESSSSNASSDMNFDYSGIGQGGGQGNPFANKAVNKAKNKVKNKVKNSAKDGAKKVGKKALKAVGKVAVKAVGAVLKWLLAFFGPWILGGIVAIIILYCAWDVIFNSRGKTQDYQTEDTNEYNTVKQNSTTGNVEAIDLSMGNKLTKAFYTYFAEKSIYVTLTDKDGKVVEKEPIQYNSPEFIKKFGELETRTLKDKYGREKMFYLNPNALWTLDEFLNKNKFRFPEQFIKPVYYDTESFALKDLVDSDGKLVAESKTYTSKVTDKYVYKQDPSDMNILKQVYLTPSGVETFEVSGNTPKVSTSESLVPNTEDKTEKGVWDYGFGSILNYKEFEEERKATGYFKTMNIWDIDNEVMIPNVPLDEAEAMCSSNPDKYEGFDSKYPKDTPFEDKLPSGTSYMIDRVTSPAGFITNEIELKWQDTGEKYVKNVSIEKEVTVWREHERQVTSGLSSVYIDKEGNDTTVPSYENDDGEIVSNSPKMETYMKKEKIKKTFTIEGVGTKLEKIPRYVGEPDLSKITGSKYYIDYMTNYKSYVPENVMTSIGISDFKNRTGVKQDDLLKLLERQSFTGTSIKNNATNGTNDMGSFEFGKGATSQAFMKSMQYYEDFKAYGDMYGVDPNLLVAIATQESSGNHEENVNESRCSVAGCGIMQIEAPGINTTSITAYNQQTKSTETMNITGMSSVADIKDNIRAGAMMISSRLKEANYNIALGLQQYNFGPGGMGAVLDLYAEYSGKTVEEIRNNSEDLGWMAYREEVHQNPSKYISWGEGTYGDPIYIENVLQYYVNSDGGYPWVTKEDGTSVSMDGSQFTMGGSTPGGVNDSWLKNIWNKLISVKEYIFPNMPPKLMEESTFYENNIPKAQAEIVNKMMFVMEEKNYLSDYEDFTDEDWKSKYYLWFTNPLGNKWKGKGGAVDTLGMFPEGFVKPLSFSPLTMDKAFESPTHMGVDIVAPMDSDVHAIAKGEVIDINDKGNGNLGKYVQIKHSSGAITLYGGLNSISVKKGDKVNADSIIGKTGNTHDKSKVLYFELTVDGKKIDPSFIITGNFNASDYDMTEEDAKIIEKVIQLAYSKIGSEYTMDAGRRSGPNSFDCSGFTWWLYNQTTGANIGSWTGEQDTLLSSYRVSADKLQPGDILMANDLHHVVLYVGKKNGRDTVVHASDYGIGVIESSFVNITSLYPKIYRPIAYARATSSTTTP